MSDQHINKPVIVSEDIFMKAALEYCRRQTIAPFDPTGNWGVNAGKIRGDLADLAERINSLKSVGAI
jgi:hypothetical protein